MYSFFFLRRETATILRKKKTNLTIAREEVLMMLRAYQLHPCSWGEIIADIRGNLPQLPPAVRDHYNQASVKQLRERLSLKLRKLLAAKSNIKDEEIRYNDLFNKTNSVE